MSIVARAKPFACVTKPGLCARAVALVHVPSLTFGCLCHDKARPVRGARSSRRLVQTSRIGASTERHGGKIRHPLGTPPRSGRRKARPSDPVETPGANELETPRTGPSNGSWGRRDRKSTRLNSSHMSISYAVFCLKKQNIIIPNQLFDHTKSRVNSFFEGGIVVHCTFAVPSCSTLSRLLLVSFFF